MPIEKTSAEYWTGEYFPTPEAEFTVEDFSIWLGGDGVAAMYHWCRSGMSRVYLPAEDLLVFIRGHLHNLGVATSDRETVTGELNRGRPPEPQAVRPWVSVNGPWAASGEPTVPSTREIFRQGEHMVVTARSSMGVYAYVEIFTDNPDGIKPEGQWTDWAGRPAALPAAVLQAIIDATADSGG